MASAYESVATAIVVGQRQVMGKVADSLASRISGLEVADDGVTITDGSTAGGIAAIEALITEYSAITGPLGVRMCFNSAKAELERHPTMQIPAFKGMQ